MDLPLKYMVLGSVRDRILDAFQSGWSQVPLLCCGVVLQVLMLPHLEPASHCQQGQMGLLRCVYRMALGAPFIEWVFAQRWDS